MESLRVSLRGSKTPAVLLNPYIGLAVLACLYLVIRIPLIVFRGNQTLAPDEYTYQLLVLWFVDGQDFINFPGYSDDSLYKSSRSLVVLGGLIAKLGFDSLLAIRIASFLYGLLALSIFYLISRKLIIDRSPSFGFVQFIPILASLALCFWPSFILWSTSGLRESSITAYFLMVIIGTYYFLDNRKSKTFPLIGICLGVFLIYSARPQTGYLLTFSLLLGTLFTWLRSKRESIKPSREIIYISCIALFSIFGNFFSTPSQVSYSNDLIAAPYYGRQQLEEQRTSKPPSTSLPSPASTESPSPASTTSQKVKCETANQVIERNGKYFVCVNKNRNVGLGQSDSNFQKIESKVKRVTAAVDNSNTSILVDCGDSLQFNISKIDCVFTSWPLRAIKVLFFPLSFSGDLMTRILPSIENIIWISLFLLLLFLLLTNFSRPRKNLYITSILISFCVSYTFALSLLSENFGTSFRHKFILLPVLLLLIQIYIPIRHKSSPSLTKSLI